MVATGFPLHVQNENVILPTLVNYKLHINEFQDQNGAWLEFFK
jgi:hypothetical protein